MAGRVAERSAGIRSVDVCGKRHNVCAHFTTINKERKKEMVNEMRVPSSVLAYVRM